MVCMIAPRMLQYNKLSCRQKPRLARSVNHGEQHSKSLFRGGKGGIPRRKLLSRAGRAKSRAGNHVSRAGKAKFHAGNHFSCVSTVANTITIAGSSCLGGEFRLGEPQRKKDFRKRSL